MKLKVNLPIVLTKQSALNIKFYYLKGVSIFQYISKQLLLSLWCICYSYPMEQTEGNAFSQLVQTKRF